MELEELKPNFRKIYKVITFSKNFPLQWEKIVKKEIQYEIANNVKITLLLKRFNLISFRNDLLFIAYCIREHYMNFILTQEELQKMPLYELAKILKIMRNNKNLIRVHIENSENKESVLIKDENVIHHIRGTLLNIWALRINPNKLTDYKKDNSLYYSFIEYLENQIDKTLSKKVNDRNKKRGKKSKNPHLGMYIDSLQKYLQNYTSIKGKSMISNKQGLIIYLLLSELRIIDTKYLYPQDNIRIIVTIHPILKNRCY
jgi:hypothetical protein